MAKARKSVAKAKKSKRGMKTRTKRRTLKALPQAKSQKRPARKARPKKKAGIVTRMGTAVEAVADTYRDTQEMRQKIGKRGGFEDA